MEKRLVLLFCIAMAGCETTREYHGHVFSPNCMESLTIGKTNSEDVIRKLGEPTYVLAYDPLTWYYLSEVRETKAFLKPKATQVLCYSVTFTPQGYLNNIEKSEGVRSLAMSSHAIPLPSSHSEEFFKQMFRNIGRFKAVKVAAP